MSEAIAIVTVFIIGPAFQFMLGAFAHKLWSTKEWGRAIVCASLFSWAPVAHLWANVVAERFGNGAPVHVSVVGQSEIECVALLFLLLWGPLVAGVLANKRFKFLNAIT